MKFFKTHQQIILILILIGLISIQTDNAAAQVNFEYHEDMKEDGLRFWYADASKPSHIFNRNIAVHGDCFDVINGYAFFVWYKGGMENRDLMLSRKKLGTDYWVTIQFPNKNTLYQGDRNGVDANGAGDSHKTAAVGVCPIDGTVHIAYDMHVHPLKYRVSKENIAFAPDEEFRLGNFSDEQDYFKPGLPIPSFTYPSFENNEAGELIVEYRLGTSRQGDKYITYYDGSTWSDLILLVKGDNENPQFNQYGDLSYHFGKMYLGCSIREYGSDITNNQGFYFAEAGQRGNEDWKNLHGQSFKLPIRGLTNFNNFKICEPLPPGNSGMTSSPELVVSKNGAVHMVNRVPDVGYVHYYTKVGSKDLIKASSSPFSLSFGGNDGRIYSVELSSEKIRVKSSPEGASDWRTDYLWNGSERFGLMKSKYYNGKIYIIASENVDSDKIPLHYIVLDLPNDKPQIPEGYLYRCNENDTIQVNAPMDIAYGADGEFRYLYNVSGDLTCSSENFGDPNPGANKKCYVKINKPVVSFINAPLDTILNLNYPQLSLSANANDSGGTIQHVALYLDDTTLIRTDSVAPYTWGSKTTEHTTELLGIPCGKHTFKALATDNDGLTTSSQFSFRVNSESCAPQISFASPLNDTTIILGTSLYVKALVQNTEGTIAGVSLFMDDKLLREDNAAPYEWGDSEHADEIKPGNGLHQLKIITTNSIGLSANALINVTVESPAFHIPGKIEAEHFSDMFGVDTETTSDLGGGLNVGSINTGDWLEYNVMIDSSATYQVEYRVTSLSTPIVFTTKLDGEDIDYINEPTTKGRQNWISVVHEVPLTKGSHKLKIEATGRWNINWIDFKIAKIVGVHKTKFDGFKVYPNPANDLLFIDFGNAITKPATIYIYNSVGRLMLSKKLVEQKNKINIHSLVKGVYMVQITSKTHENRSKFLKN